MSSVNLLRNRFEHGVAVQKEVPPPVKTKKNGPPPVKREPFSLHPKSIKAPVSIRSTSSNASANATPPVRPKPQMKKNTPAFEKELHNVLKIKQPTPTFGNKGGYFPSPTAAEKNVSLPSIPEKPGKIKFPASSKALPERNTDLEERLASRQGPDDWTKVGKAKNIVPPVDRDSSIPSSRAPPTPPHQSDGSPLVVSYKGKRLPSTVLINDSLYKLVPLGPPREEQAPEKPERPCNVMLTPDLIAEGRNLSFTHHDFKVWYIKVCFTRFMKNVLGDAVSLHCI